MYDIAVAQLVPNALASILLFIATCRLKHLEYMALVFSYLHIIQHNIKTCGDKGWYLVACGPSYMSSLDKPSSIHGWKYRFVFIKKANGN